MFQRRTELQSKKLHGAGLNGTLRKTIFHPLFLGTSKPKHKRPLLKHVGSSKVYAMWAYCRPNIVPKSMALLPGSDWVDRDNQALDGRVWGPVLWGCRAGVYVGDQLPNPWLEAGSVGHGDADGPGCCLHMVCMGHDVQQWETGVTRDDDSGGPWEGEGPKKGPGA